MKLYVRDFEKIVLDANIELVARSVVIYTRGNVSEIDPSSGIVAIKPSGVDYDTMTIGDIVLVSLESGESVEGKWKSSSDTSTHLELYRVFLEI